MILLAKTGKIGDIVSVDSVCTSLREVDYTDENAMKQVWNSMATWAPIALLPVFQLLGTAYKRKHIYSRVAKMDYQTSIGGRSRVDKIRQEKSDRSLFRCRIQESFPFLESL